MIEHILQEYHMLNLRFGSCATLSQLEELETALGANLIDDLKRFYLDHNGEYYIKGSSQWLPFRLMAIDEVIDTHQYTVAEGLATEGVRLFYSDDNGNYAAIYLEGPLSGKMCHVNHEELDISPVYRSFCSFVQAVLDGAKNNKDWPDIERDYPAFQPLDKSLADHDWEIAKNLRKMYNSIPSKYIPLSKSQMGDQLRTRIAYSIMSLTPPDRTASLLEFLYDINPWVQEYACNIIGKRRYKPALERLIDLSTSKETISNVNIATIVAIRRIEG